LSPNDDDGLRGSMIAAFRNRGIMPLEAVSLAEESLVLSPPSAALQLHDAEVATLARLLQEAASRVEASDEDDDDPPTTPPPPPPPGVEEPLAILLHRFADRNRNALLLHARSEEHTSELQSRF